MTIEIAYLSDGSWCPVTALTEQDDCCAYGAVTVDELVEYSADDVLGS